MLNFQELNNKILPQSSEAMHKTQLRLNSIAKPIASLGILEDMLVDIAGLTSSSKIDLSKKAVLVFCADNGVVCEGVTQTDSSVTHTVAENIANNKASVCHMAKIAKADVFSIDVGMNTKGKSTLDYSVAFGTKNIANEPAMTQAQAEQAISVGIEFVKKLKDRGYKLIATGEMGIGNTTTSSAVASVLLSLPPNLTTGYGAGLSTDGLNKKIAVIERAILVNKPNKDDAFDVLVKLGGFDICAMVGAFLGGAIHRVPILIDGVISTVAALLAYKLCPNSIHAMFATHLSAEMPASLILKELNKKPIIHADMHLGEGTGAVCTMPILDMALSVYNNMVSFNDINLKPYEVLKK